MGIGLVETLIFFLIHSVNQDIYLIMAKAQLGCQIVLYIFKDIKFIVSNSLKISPFISGSDI